MLLLDLVVSGVDDSVFSLPPPFFPTYGRQRCLIHPLLLLRNSVAEFSLDSGSFQVGPKFFSVGSTFAGAPYVPVVAFLGSTGESNLDATKGGLLSCPQPRVWMCVSV